MPGRLLFLTLAIMMRFLPHTAEFIVKPAIFILTGKQFPGSNEICLK
jgi:hypothetical protein